MSETEGKAYYKIANFDGSEEFFIYVCGPKVENFTEVCDSLFELALERVFLKIKNGISESLYPSDDVIYELVDLLKMKGYERVRQSGSVYYDCDIFEIINSKDNQPRIKINDKLLKELVAYNEEETRKSNIFLEKIVNNFFDEKDKEK